MNNKFNNNLIIKRSHTSIQHGVSSRGYVRWILTDEKTGKITKGGRSNLLVNKTRENLASAIIGTSVTFPGFIGVGTGTNTPAASDTALQTKSQYNGSNDNKAVDSKTIRSIYTARFVVQFATGEANVTIREIGLFDAADSAVMWARVAVNITKTSSSRLTVYWYIIFDRSLDVAIKSGASVAATGTASSGTAFTATFPSAVTILMIHNNSGNEMYGKFNEGLDAATPPVDYDFKLDDNESLLLLNEEISVTTISIYTASNNTGALPINDFGLVGW